MPPACCPVRGLQDPLLGTQNGTQLFSCHQVGENTANITYDMVAALMICPAGAAGAWAISPTTARGGGYSFSAGRWTQGEVRQILRNRICVEVHARDLHRQPSNSSQRQAHHM
jgi:hypothetical protein